MPYLAQKLNIFVKLKEVVKVSEGVCTIFRDYGYREKHTRARVKFLVADWGVEKFFELAEISTKYGDGKLRTTLTQNLIVSGISDEKVPYLLSKDIFKHLKKID